MCNEIVLSISDIIEIISIICNSFLSIIAITISVITLIQNNKMIFESNKPYITIFSKIVDFSSPKTYLILKNFGTSGATILSIESSEKILSPLSKSPFTNLNNFYIAPGQSFLYPLLAKQTELYDKIFNFKITYKYLNKIYTETCNISFNNYKDICYIKSHTSSNKDIKELSEVLQEMTIQNL